jgi:hypothetical protein
MNNSAVELRNVPIEYVVGVRMGSMESVERSNKGVEEDIKVGIQAWSNVAGSKRGLTVHDGRRERHGYIDRGGEEMGVTIRRVRTISRGASKAAAIAVAAMATPRDINGLGLSIISRPPIPLAELTRLGSGTLRTADMALRNQLSVVFKRKL